MIRLLLPSGTTRMPTCPHPSPSPSPSPSSSSYGGVTGLDPSRALVPRTVVDAVVAEAE